MKASPKEGAKPAATGRKIIEGTTLSIVAELAEELRPNIGARDLARLDSNLDRDLGFDSLGRSELILRLDRAFKVRLPDALIGDAVTPRDIVEAIASAEPAKLSPDAFSPVERSKLDVITAPVAAKSLVEVLKEHANNHPVRPHLGIWLGDRIGEQLSYGQLHRDALTVGHQLSERGLEAGERVAIMLPTGLGFFRSFFGILYAGGIPVPIYPPFRRAQVEDHIRRQAGILNNSEASLLITEEEISRVGNLLKGLVPTLRHVLTADALVTGARLERPYPCSADTTALIQYTSGSTGDPKGVVLSHANLLANIRAMGAALQATSNDVFVSWLPLYHDMGLIGAWLGSLYYGAYAIVMSPMTFLADPARWLRAISQQGGTLSAAPNFAFELCLKNIRDEDLIGLDLSGLRAVVNGAEPVSPATVRNFTKRFAQIGFRPEALEPVYGLAECSVGLAFPPLGRKPIIQRIDRSSLAESGVAAPADESDKTAIEFVACGRPLTNHQIRIVDELGLEVSERQQGRLQFMGPSATSGYFRDDEKTKKLFNGGWLESGDLAYISDGDIFLTGRVKDMIIRAGRNIYPHEIEEFIGQLPGVRKGCVVAFGSPDPRTGSERLVILAETRMSIPSDLTQLDNVIRDATLEILQLPPDEVVLAPPHTIPKTSSGKIRRSAAKALFEAGALEEQTKSFWWQIARLEAAGFLNRLRRALRSAGVVTYGAYWWLVLALLAVVVWPLVVLLPRRSWRHAVIGKAVRIWFASVGIPQVTKGRPQDIPDRVIIVSNHASYIDGAALSAAIPGTLTFIAKEEFADQFWAGHFLRNLGTIFVRRVDRAASVKGADVVISAAIKGERIVAFPEGTLLRRPGLLSFRLGAFVAAIDARVPVVPVAIRGTRTVLRGEQWVPRPGRISVEIGRPIEPEGEGFEVAVRLRDKAREWILTHCGEPDLGGEDVDLAAWGQR